MRLKLNIYVVIGLLVITTLTREVKAGSYLPPSIKELQEKSLIICVGSVTEVTEMGTEEINIDTEKVSRGTFKAEVLMATMEVKLIIKGDDVPETIKIRCHRKFPSFIFGIGCGNVIIFLNFDGENYVPTDENGFWIPVSPAAFKVPKDATLSDILRTSLSSNDTKIGVGAIRALKELEGAKSKEWIRPLLKSPNELIVEEAIDTLVKLEGEDSKESIRPLLKSPNDYIKGRALIAFLKLKDYELFDEAIKLVKTDYTDGKMRNVVGEIAAEIMDIRDKSLIPKLNRLVLHEHPLLRQHACWSLAQIGNKTSVPFLIKALTNKSEENIDVLDNSHHALHRIIKKGGPTWKDFSKESDKCIKQWEEWWEKNKDNPEFQDK